MTSKPGEAPGGVTAEVDRDTVSATGVVAATPQDVFEYLRRPANHAAISGDGTVRDTVGGAERLELGSKFGMKMRLGVPYRVSSKVVEFEQDRRIAWAHFGRHRWRWELEPVDESSTRVTETFDLAPSVFPPGLRVAGFPARHRDNVVTSVANVMAHFSRPS